MSRTKLAILMGGSGSTGSSLLRTIFDRHSSVFSGEELSFFNKDQYYLSWSRYKRRALYQRFRRPLSTRGWFAYPGSALLHDDYGWRRPEVEQLLEASTSIREFAEHYFCRPLQRSGTSFWIEKTPSNSYCFGHFLRQFPNGRVIHTARNPLDSVKSLIFRGMSPFFASALWLYNTACALSAERSCRYHLVRYEDLIREPKRVVGEACDFLQIPYEPEMLEPRDDGTAEHVRNKGWSHARTEPIRSDNIDTFHELEEESQARVLTALTVLRVSKKHCVKRELPVRSSTEVCDRLGYAGFDTDRSRLSKIVWKRRKDMLRRAWERLPTSFGNYPIAIER